MKFTVLELKDRYIKFEVEGISYSIANMLRRTLINDIPKLAIKNVSFHLGTVQKETQDGKVETFNSSSPLFNEIIAHRLGLIPLPTDLKMKFRDECQHPPDQACPLCTVTYTLSKFGPCVVYSGDLIPVGDPAFAPVEKNIPIVKLNEKQALLIDAEAVMGTAKEHARWQVTSGVSYKYHREFQVPKGHEMYSILKNECSRSIISENEGYLVVTDDVPCMHIARLYQYKDVKVVEDDKRFIFQFETDGSLTAKDTLLVAIKRLRDRLEKIRESITV